MMRPVSTVLIAGATGLVGRSVLALAGVDPRVSRVVAPTRRPLPSSAKLENPLVDFERLPLDAPWWRVDAAISTLGTTIRAAGSQAAFRRVDHDYILAVATQARAHGAQVFALTSAMGANPRSRIFYNRVKGETEADVTACGFPSLAIIRPGVIGGDRSESRPAEYAAIRLLGVIGPVLPRKLRLSPVEHIARALLEAALAPTPGIRVIEADALA